MGLLSSCSTDVEEPRFDNPLDPRLGAGLPVPQAVIVSVGDARVGLSWSLSEGETADGYAIFRKRLDAEPEEAERLLSQVEEPTYTDLAVRNGRVYAYRLAAKVGGQLGPRTEAIEARPGLFTILIENDQEVTASREVTVTVNAAGATSVLLSEDPDLASGQWRAAAASVPWSLPPSDGMKSLYARFRLTDGSETEIVSDAITLDTRAVIAMVEFTGQAVRAPGETIHFRIDAGERDGRATISIDDVFPHTPLLDDGTGGDAVAGDGIYERDLTIPAAANATETEVRGDFTDLAGNVASQATATRLISVQRPPRSITIVSAIVAEPPDPPSVKLRWTRSLDTRFSQYRVFRAETSSVDTMSELVHTEFDAATVEFTDTDVHEGQSLHYRVYVRNEAGLEVPSNVMDTDLPNVRPPAPVDIHSSLDAGKDRIVVRWDKSNERDFAFYRLYRNEDGAVSDDDLLVAEIDDVDQTFFDDTGLQENTSYYYRLYTVDLAGLTARGNEVEAKTKNETPEAVTLNAATAVDTTALTLSWEESTAHDFESYRLYRDDIATVTTGSTLVVELDDAAFTSFRDTELEIGTRYWYRVFVMDDADEHAGSNTISVTTADTTGGRP